MKGIISYSKETDINDKAKVKVTEMGNIIELQYMARRNSKQTVHRIDEATYFVISTGEVKEFENNSDNRSENVNSLRKTFRKLRGVINSNFAGKENELHITLTYRWSEEEEKEPMTDEKKLYRDFKRFMTRLRRRYSNLELSYISVVEPQKSGAWHCHLLIKSIKTKNLFIPWEEIEEMWSEGFVKVKGLKDIDNIGAYLSAYLSNVEISDDKEAEDGQEVLIKEVEGVTKKFIKGGRLHYYPPGMNLFRTSRNIKRPREYLTTYEEAKSANNLGKAVYTQKIEVDKDDFKNTIMYEQYNTKRKN